MQMWVINITYFLNQSHFTFLKEKQEQKKESKRENYESCVRHINNIFKQNEANWQQKESSDFHNSHFF